MTEDWSWNKVLVDGGETEAEAHSSTEMRPRQMLKKRSTWAAVQGLQLSVSEAPREAEQSAAADEGTKDIALLTLHPHQTCSEQLTD